jgi:hypothetical protein
MWAARGDSFGAPNINVTAARAWCEANLDVDATLTSLALINWMGAWDDVCHNQFFWRRANGKWTRISWDFDDLMSSNRQLQSVFVGETGAPDPFFGTNWFKDTILKCYHEEYRQRLWELNNSLLDPVNLGALGFTNAANFANTRRTNVNTQLGLGTYNKPARPTNIQPPTAGWWSQRRIGHVGFSYPRWARTRDEVGNPQRRGRLSGPVFVLTSTSQRRLPVPGDR